MHIRHGIVVMVLLPIFLSLVFLPSPPSSHTHTIKMQSLWRCEGNTMSHKPHRYVFLRSSSQNHDDGALDLGGAQLLVFPRPICLFFKTRFFVLKVLHLLHGNSCGLKTHITSPMTSLLVIRNCCTLPINFGVYFKWEHYNLHLCCYCKY